MKWLLLVVGLLLLATRDGLAFEIFPEHDWTLTIKGYQFGYVEWPRENSAANYVNSKPFELHLGRWTWSFRSRAVPIALAILSSCCFVLGLVLLVRLRAPSTSSASPFAPS